MPRMSSLKYVQQQREYTRLVLQVRQNETTLNATVCARPACSRYGTLRLGAGMVTRLQRIDILEGYHRSAVAPLVPAWKADDVPDVGYASKVAQKAIESKAEAAMRYASVPSKV